MFLQPKKGNWELIELNTSNSLPFSWFTSLTSFINNSITSQTSLSQVNSFVGYLPSIPEFNRKIRQEVQSVFKDNLNEERTSFLARMQNEETRPQVVVEFLKESGKDLTREQQTKEINRI